MIYEYALDPDLVSDETMCGILASSFGESRGRLVAEFPEHWASLVWVAMDGKSAIQKQRITEALARLSRRTIRRRRTWDDTIDEHWLRQAIREHGHRPFKAIMSGGPAEGDRSVIAPSAMDEIDPRWAVDTTIIINRTPAEMRGCVGTLLECAEDVIFVDYFFEPNEQKWLRPLREFLRCLVGRENGLPVNRVEFHTQARAETGFFKTECERSLARIVPRGLPFTVIRWAGHADLHNRYVLTNRGGIAFQHGLDDGPGTDDATLLPPKTYSIRWRHFQPASSPFTKIDEFPVNGTA